MFSKQKTRQTPSLALRLTLWYASIFTISSLIAYSIFYFVMAGIIYDRTDEELIEDIDESAILFKQEGLSVLRKEFEEDASENGAENIFFRLIDEQGHILLATDLSSWPDLNTIEDIHQSKIDRDKSFLETVHYKNHKYATRIVTGYVDKNIILQIGQSFEDDDVLLQSFRNIFAVTLPLIMLIAGLFGWFMTRKALQGVKEVTNAAIDITKGDLSRRVPESSRGDELDLMANTFNTMLDRIQTLLSGMREMNDNIAHDLRSPLTRIRGIAETTLLNNPSLDDFRSVAGNTIEECDRLLHMINTMLDITETEAGEMKSEMAPINMAEITSDACELYRPLAEDKEITLKCSFIERATVNGSVQHLQRMIGNLLDNAMKYTPAGGVVTLNLHQNNGNVYIEISDNGCGVAKEDLDKIFKRFYRCDQSRLQMGSGLGLSLALVIARAHGGDITVQSSPNRGSTFTISIPEYN